MRITLPMIGNGLIAGGLIAFITSCVELASTIMLVPRIELGPIAYGIYLYMQSPSDGAPARPSASSPSCWLRWNLSDPSHLRRTRR